MCLSNVKEEKALKSSVRFSLTSEDIPFPSEFHDVACDTLSSADWEQNLEHLSNDFSTCDDEVFLSLKNNNSEEKFYSFGNLQAETLTRSASNKESNQSKQDDDSDENEDRENEKANKRNDESNNNKDEKEEKDCNQHIELKVSRKLDEFNNNFQIASSSNGVSHYKDLKKSLSFPSISVIRRASFPNFYPSLCEMTPQELSNMVHPTKPEPSKISKIQIKEYSKKYKHMERGEMSKTPWYKDPLEYTQPAHLVAIVAFIYLAFRLFPDARRSQSEASTLTRLLYVSSISAVFGSQFWMTFVSGLALFFNVSRHIFAKVQTVLFPLYFLTNSVLMLVVIVTYTQHHPTHLWDTHQLIQGGMLVFCFIVNLGIRLYLAPVMTKLITIKMAIESETGLGNEVGSNRPGVLVRCPHYMRLYRNFRKIHMIIAIGNMAAMAATSFHLYYLASKLCSVDL